MGSDLTVVNAARVSFDKESSWITKGEERTDEFGTYTADTESLSERDNRLIHYLSSHGHWTPFSHPQIILRETVPIFVARQRFKHVVGFSYNEVSRRYVDSPPEFYTPEEWRGAPTNRKQGSSSEIICKGHQLCNKTPFDDSDGMYYDELMQQCLTWYTVAIQKGVAPEQARMVLPQSMYTSYYVTGSLAAWARAYTLRASSDAQEEIRNLASQWDSLIAPLFPVSWKALTKNEN